MKNMKINVLAILIGAVVFTVIVTLLFSLDFFKSSTRQIDNCSFLVLSVRFLLGVVVSAIAVYFAGKKRNKESSRS